MLTFMRGDFTELYNEPADPAWYAGLPALPVPGRAVFLGCHPSRSKITIACWNDGRTGPDFRDDARELWADVHGVDAVDDLRYVVVENEAHEAWRAVQGRADVDEISVVAVLPPRELTDPGWWHDALCAHLNILADGNVSAALLSCGTQLSQMMDGHVASSGHLSPAFHGDNDPLADAVERREARLRATAGSDQQIVMNAADLDPRSAAARAVSLVRAHSGPPSLFLLSAGDIAGAPIAMANRPPVHLLEGADTTVIAEALDQQALLAALNTRTPTIAWYGTGPEHLDDGTIATTVRGLARTRGTVRLQLSEARAGVGEVLLARAAAFPVPRAFTQDKITIVDQPVAPPQGSGPPGPPPALAYRPAGASPSAMDLTSRYRRPGPPRRFSGPA